MFTEIEDIENELFKNLYSNESDTCFQFLTKSVETDATGETRVEYYFTMDYGVVANDPHKDVACLVLDPCTIEEEKTTYGFICEISVLNKDYDWKPIIDTVIDITNQSKNEIIKQLQEELKKVALILYMKNLCTIN